MGDLVIELALAFLAATLIGWLMGRFLCKSGEYNERAARRRLETELAGLGKELAVSRETADGLRRQLAERIEAAALFEQEGAGLRARLAGMESPPQEPLGTARELETCNARRRALEAELEDLQGSMLELRATCAAQAHRIAELDGTLERTRAELRASDAENRPRQEEIAAGRDRQAENDARIATLQQEKLSLEQQLRQRGAEHDGCLERLQALTASVDRLHRRVRERGVLVRPGETHASEADRPKRAQDQALPIRAARSSASGRP